MCIRDRDRTSEVYRLIYAKPQLHLLCPNFDPDFPSDVDWDNEWIFEMYTRGYQLGVDPIMPDFTKWVQDEYDLETSNVNDFSIVPSGSTS